MLRKRTMIFSWIMIMLCVLIAPVPVSAKEYYTMKEVGISDFSGAPYYQIRSWKGNTITYRVYDTTYGSDDPVIGKWKKAKINSKTKYYVGDYGKYDEYQTLCQYLFGFYDYSNNVDYLKKSTKAKSRKWVRKYKTPRVDMVIKKGKVKKLVYNAQVAG